MKCIHSKCLNEVLVTKVTANIKKYCSRRCQKLAHQVRWHTSNHESNVKADTKWRLSHPAQVAERNLKYIRCHPEKAAAHYSKRNAIRLGHTKHPEWYELFVKAMWLDKESCSICKAQFVSGQRKGHQVDHIFAHCLWDFRIILGCTLQDINDKLNLQVICHSCHASKTKSDLAIKVACQEIYKSLVVGRVDERQ